MRERWRVLDCAVAEQHQDEIIYRIKVRAPSPSSEDADKCSQSTYVVFVSQPPGRGVPYDVGADVELDARLLEQE